MQAFGFISLRSFWRRLHLWLGFGLGVLVVPIGLTGTVLVVAEELDRLIDPAFHAVSGAGPVLSTGEYVANGIAAVPGAVASRLRFPMEEGAPVLLSLRGGVPSAAEKMWAVALDPPTGRVLGVKDVRGTFVGLVHSFHANLLLPGFNGRSVVGWAGVGLVMSVLTGLALWWPGRGRFLRGLGWRRNVVTSINLHHVFGAWICIPLAVAAATGVTLAFPDQTRAVIGQFAAATPRPEQGGRPIARPVLGPDSVVARALAGFEAPRLVSLTFPTERAKAWRVQVALGEELRTVTIEDTTGTATVLPAARPGDLVLSTLRRLHEGDHNGPVWRAIVFVTGLGPAILLVTGLVMWRRRSNSVAVRPHGPCDEVAFRPGKEQDAAA